MGREGGMREGPTGEAMGTGQRNRRKTGERARRKMGGWEVREREEQAEERWE